LTIGRNAAGAAAAGVVGVVGGKISFPAVQAASSDANTLDDYEEGTATITLVSSGATFSYGAQICTYVKIGQDVDGSVAVVLNGSGNTLTANALSWSGAPFTNNATVGIAPWVTWHQSTTSYISATTLFAAGGTTGTYNALTAAATGILFTTAPNSNALLHATNGSQLYWKMTYRAAA
jgi:hypothetical protein